MEKPLATGAVMPSGKPLARAMAKFVDPSLEGRVIELGPGTGAVHPGAPFVQFTYAVVPPIPRSLDGATAECSERIWLNLPPARVWVYRRG